MFTKRFFRVPFCLVFVIVFFLTGVLPVHADSSTSPLHTTFEFLDIGYGITTDSNGNVYTVGTFAGVADFDPGPGTANLTSAGIDDVFISKLDNSGNFVWAKSMGGTDRDLGVNIALDSNGNVYIIGSFKGTADFNPGTHVSNLTSAGDQDIFVSKLDGNGNFVWGKRMGGTGADFGTDIAVDTNGNICITGAFKSIVDFDPGAGIVNLTSAGDHDIFVSKLDGNGNFVWAKSMGGSQYADIGTDIAVDSSNNVYTTGYFAGYFGSTTDFDPGAAIFNLTSAGSNDIFVSKLDGNGNFVWAKSMGGPSYDIGSGIALDSTGNVYTTGDFDDATADFDPSTRITNLTHAGASDIFVSKLDGDGNFVWAKSMGGTDNDYGNDIAVDKSGNVYTTGQTGFPLDIFVSKLDGSGNLVFAKSMGGANHDIGYGIAVDKSGNIHTTGYFQDTADFDPSRATANLTSAGGFDIFVSKLSSNSSFVWAKSMGGTGSTPPPFP